MLEHAITNGDQSVRPLNPFVRLSVCHTREPRLHVQDIEILVAPYERAM